MNKIILADHHCHICNAYYDDPTAFIEDLEKNTELEYLVNVGVNYDNNKELLELKKSLNSDFMKIGLGLHPEEVIELGRFHTHELARIIEQIESNIDSVDYIGEIGIDFFYPNSRDFEKEQKEVFSELVKIALKHGKPMSIHARQSFDEIIEIIDQLIPEKIENAGFLHCFTGDFDQGMFFIEKGFKLGINGIITYKKSEELRQTIKALIDFYKDKDFNDLFGLETDAPYLSPEPVRSEKNTPANISIIQQFISLTSQPAN